MALKKGEGSTHESDEEVVRGLLDVLGGDARLASKGRKSVKVDDNPSEHTGRRRDEGKDPLALGAMDGRGAEGEGSLLVPGRAGRTGGDGPVGRQSGRGGGRVKRGRRGREIDLEALDELLDHPVWREGP